MLIFSSLICENKHTLIKISCSHLFPLPLHLEYQLTNLANRPTSAVLGSYIINALLNICYCIFNCHRKPNATQEWYINELIADIGSFLRGQLSLLQYIFKCNNLIHGLLIHHFYAKVSCPMQHNL